MSWFALSLLTAGIGALVILADKFFLVNVVKTPATAIKVLGIGSLLFFLILALFGFNHFVIDYLIVLPIIAGVFEIISIYFYLRAISKDEVAYLIPIFALAPIFTLIISLLLVKTSFTLIPIIGIFIIIAGITLLVISRYGGMQFRLDKNFFLMVLSGFFFGLQAFFSDLSMEKFSLYENVTISRLGIFIGALLIIILTRSWNFASLKNAKVYFFILPDLMYLLSVWTFFAALNKGSAAYVTGVINIQPLFVFVAGYLLWRFWPKLLQEHFSFKKPLLAVISIIIVIIGSIMINQ